MLQQLRFYFNHSVNDLRVNGQRTFFALLCIAAGVAAIVSLQTLAGMIQSTLTSNLQSNNRGDIQLSTRFGNSESAETALEKGADAGFLLADPITFAGFQNQQYSFSEAGVNTLKTWFETRYPESKLTYRQVVTDPIGIFTGSGMATLLTTPDNRLEASGVSPVMIESELYPFYSDVRTLDGKTLQEALQSPSDVILGVTVAEALEVSTGDTILINGLNGTFTVAGIVPTEAEVRNPTQDIFAALNGFYIVDMRTREKFESLPFKSNIVYVQLPNGTDVQAIEDSLREEFDFLRITTTEDLRANYTTLSDNVNQLVTVMGMISLLLGSIGIINTMQVIVRRRVKEIAVLKTIGLQARQITELFLFEAFIMGVLGSIAGVLLGWVMVFVIKGVAEGVLGSSLPFQISINAVVGGVVVGTLVTTVFGFLPTLSAGLIRPAAVLRPDDSPLPRAGILRNVLALAFMMITLSLISYTILNNLVLAFGVVIGAFIIALLLYLLLAFFIWVIGRFMPSFGVIDLKIALREMLATRSRNAVTLLALVVGVFSLSLITLLADTVATTLAQAFLTGDNVYIQVGGGESGLKEVESRIAQLEGENTYAVTRTYNLTFEALERANGETLDRQGVNTILQETDFFLQLANNNATATEAPESQANNTPNNRGNLQDRRLREFDSLYGAIDAITPDTLRNSTLLEGRQLTAEDVGKPYIVVESSQSLIDLGIKVGDKLQYTYSYGGFLGVGATTGMVTYEIIGITKVRENVNLAEGGQFVMFDVLPEGMPPSQIRMTANIQEDQISKLRRSLGELPQTFLLETEAINRLILAFVGQFTAFPLLVALLGLIVGGIVIANSVALSTMERRREIAIMKSIGLQRERVLGLLLLENSVLGLIGGLIGVGLGLVGLVILLGQNAPDVPLPIGTAFILMGLCVVVALVAAMTTAWGASGEKPLNVLRYE